jgi:hypothetical protein
VDFRVRCTFAAGFFATLAPAVLGLAAGFFGFAAAAFLGAAFFAGAAGAAAGAAAVAAAAGLAAAGFFALGAAFLAAGFFATFLAAGFFCFVRKGRDSRCTAAGFFSPAGAFFANFREPECPGALVKMPFSAPRLMAVLSWTRQPIMSSNGGKNGGRMEGRGIIPDSQRQVPRA